MDSDTEPNPTLTPVPDSNSRRRFSIFVVCYAAFLIHALPQYGPLSFVYRMPER